MLQNYIYYKYSYSNDHKVNLVSTYQISQSCKEIIVQLLMFGLSFSSLWCWFNSIKCFRVMFLYTQYPPILLYRNPHIML